MTKKKWNSADDERFRTLWGEGMPIAEIAVFVGCSETAAARRRIELGLPSRIARGKQPWTAEDDAKLRRLWDSGVRGRDLMRLLGRVSISEVNRRAEALKLTRVKPKFAAEPVKPQWVGIHPDRVEWGRHPLPAFHPISCAAIGLKCLTGAR